MKVYVINRGNPHLFGIGHFETGMKLGIPLLYIPGQAHIEYIGFIKAGSFMVNPAAFHIRKFEQHPAILECMEKGFRGEYAHKGEDFDLASLAFEFDVDSDLVRGVIEKGERAYKAHAQFNARAMDLMHVAEKAYINLENK